MTNKSNKNIKAGLYANKEDGFIIEVKILSGNEGYSYSFERYNAECGAGTMRNILRYFEFVGKV